MHRSISPARDTLWMHRCLELAGCALSAGDVPVGAIVVLGDRVIGEGFERTRDALDPSAHAEVEALRAACRATGRLELSDATLYTTAEPCVLCAYAIRRVRVCRVVFGVEAGALGGVTGPFPLLTNNAFGAAGSPPEVLGGILAEACAELLSRRAHRR